MDGIALFSETTLTAEFEALTMADRYTLLMYRLATFVTLNVIDDAAMLAFGLS